VLCSCLGSLSPMRPGVGIYFVLRRLGCLEGSVATDSFPGKRPLHVCYGTMLLLAVEFKVRLKFYGCNTPTSLTVDTRQLNIVIVMKEDDLSKRAREAIRSSELRDEKS